ELSSSQNVLSSSSRWSSKRSRPFLFPVKLLDEAGVFKLLHKAHVHEIFGVGLRCLWICQCEILQDRLIALGIRVRRVQKISRMPFPGIFKRFAIRQPRIFFLDLDRFLLARFEEMNRLNVGPHVIAHEFGTLTDES